MSRSDRVVVAAVGGALVLAGAAAWVALAPLAGTADGAPGVPSPMPLLGAALPSTSDSAPTAAGTIVVDVQGAVAQPGVRELPAGSRVADAIRAAGGYAADADLVAASLSINLAQPLVDGAQVRVPRIGDGAPPPGSSADPGPADSGTGGDGDGGPLNLNTASPEELEALPGIGPVTVQKIVAARAERPFASLEEAVERGILNRGQLEQIQGLATAG